MMAQMKQPFRKKIAKFLQSGAFVISTAVVGGVGTGAAIYDDASTWETVDPSKNAQMEKAYTTRLDEMVGIRASFEAAQDNYHLTVAAGDQQKMQKTFKNLQEQETSISYQSTEIAKGILTANMDEKTAEQLATQFIKAGLVEYSDIKLHDQGMSGRNESIHQNVTDINGIHGFNAALRDMQDVREQKLIAAPMMGILGGIGFMVLGFGIFVVASDHSRRLDRWRNLPDVPKSQSGLKGLKKALQPNAPKRN